MVGVGIDFGIDTERNRSFHSKAPGYLLYHFKLSGTLNIEA